MRWPDVVTYDVQLLSSQANIVGQWSLGAMCKHGKAAQFEVGRRFGIDTVYGQPGGGATQHLWGWAADSMVTDHLTWAQRKAKLYLMRDWLLSGHQANANRLHVNQIITWETIATAERDWTIRPYRVGDPSDSAAHRNHLHLTFDVPLGRTDVQQPTLPRYVPPVWPGPAAWSQSPWVTWLGWQLLSRGAGQQYTPGPMFTEADRERVAAFQKAQGWTGSGADGLMGAKTFLLLATGAGHDIPQP